MQAIRAHGVDWLTALLQGLEGYDSSLYREWMLNNTTSDSDVGEDQPRLSYHAYTQDTMLLNQILIQTTLLCQSLVRDRSGKPAIDPVYFQPPGPSIEPEPAEATYESMKAWMRP
ncbi:hypothetical protein [Bifidobacterium olomucense]|uniref:Uncharacterized protein n=1 Tax=Bifidobacterium olomucense TaxID=2675324 RepID=A0A7Y0EXG1_9BIFI|nr:hypothetical protein [Bifidobacterium sp. DSM 109959]NMM98159.1 hypothetical protein [Bifidobacterium sp. DSM 109959]